MKTKSIYVKEPHRDEFGIIPTLTIDSNTGAVLPDKTKKINVVVNDKESFFFMFSSILPIIMNKKLNHSSIRLFAYLLEKFNSSGTFDIGASVREEICLKCDLKEVTIYDSLKNLVKANLLLKKNLNKRGGYEINPIYIWKGALDERKKKIEFNLNVSYESK